MKSVATHLRQEWRDLNEIGLPHLLARSLPWSVCTKALRRLAWLQRKRVALPSLVLPDLWNGLDQNQVRHQVRWHQLVERADAALAMADKADARRVHRIQGEWPTQPFIAAGIHWGSALWVLPLLRKLGHAPALIYRPLQDGEFRNRRYAHRVAARRLRFCEAMAQGEGLPLGNSFQMVEDKLRRDQTVVAVPDAPVHGSGGAGINVLGLPGRIRTGIFRLAAKYQYPMAPFRMWVDHATGERHLVIEPVVKSHRIEPLVQAVAANLNAALTTDPTAWFYWSTPQALFSRPLD